MDAQAILTKIEQDAKEAAQQLVVDAKEKAKSLQLEAQNNLAMLEKTMLAQADEEGARMEERMQRMADLDNRKALLALKRTMIDEAFAMAKEKLSQTKPDQQRAFYLKQVVQCATGAETLIAGAEGAQWFDENFLDEANKALEAAGKPGKLTQQADKRSGMAGIALAFKGAEVRITFDALLDEARAEMEQAAAQALFTE